MQLHTSWNKQENPEERRRELSVPALEIIKIGESEVIVAEGLHKVLVKMKCSLHSAICSSFRFRIPFFQSHNSNRLCSNHIRSLKAKITQTSCQ